MTAIASALMHDDYATQSATTDSRDYAYLFDNLPTDLAGIAAVTQGLGFLADADRRAAGG